MIQKVTKRLAPRASKGRAKERAKELERNKNKILACPPYLHDFRFTIEHVDEGQISGKHFWLPQTFTIPTFPLSKK